MNISSKLADENHQRFANWHTPFDLDNAKQAIFAFRGDVYLGLQAEDFSTADLNFAQDTPADSVWPVRHAETA